MTLQEVLKRVNEINKGKMDYEAIHDMEDNLYHDFVKHIAETGTKEQRSLARAVLMTEDVSFPRHCA